ncbi:MAG: neutral/alkaline non-lysosomal ceramidase N-terminal domain-containing protein [Planctomycetes bacterium]|nr:neutral/alkaline non-lysosomal ceramidase N-terminal domain-containing protein [Planctomycetota bacterium]
MPRVWMVVVRRLLVVLLALVVGGSTARGAEALWQAGVARAVITPEQNLWMAGYGGRTHPAEGKLHDLWVKALALQDAGGRRVVVVSTDLLGIPQSIYENTVKSLKGKFGLDRADIMLHSSHTHCGPVLRGALYDVYPLDDAQRKLIEEYSARLEQTIVQTVGKALEDLKPARLEAAEGTTDFAVNRRNNLEPEVPRLREENALKGPVDHTVPVLAVRSPEGSLRAVVFGYACHNTTLSFYQWCGDYAGFAQLDLEKRHPQAIAMFFMGCGADQNPLPRRTVELCEKYGGMLAEAVDRVLSGKMRELKPEIRTAVEMVTLRLGDPPSREELQKIAAGNDYRARWAKRLLGELKAGNELRRTYPYPVQAWKLDDQLWIALGGEVVVDYALGFKKLFGERTWVAGYANDVMAYIPSLRVLEEDVPPRASSRWGYEGNTSMVVYGLPAHRWADDIEQRITDAARRLVEEVTR